MISESVLNIECSMFDSAKSKVPCTVKLLDWLLNDQYLPLQEKVCSAVNEHDKRIAKESMPCITTSGVFSQRGNNYLVKHSRLIAINIDLKENKHIANYQDLKNELSKIQNVAYCGLSVSRTGFWLIIPIIHPDKHEEHFNHIRQYFASKSLFIDKACKDVARLRFYSYDKEAYFNHHAKPLNAHSALQLIKPHPKHCSNLHEQSKPIWSEYNDRNDFINVLLKHGWRICGENSNKIYFTRPGKPSGTSAEFDNQKNVFYVFTDNGYPFEPNKGYNPFQVYAELEHDGDFKKATKTLLYNISD